VVDLGCGPGTATAGLRRKWPDAEILGIDNSAVMISRALDTLFDQPSSSAVSVESDAAHPRPALTFLNDDITTWRPAPASIDVILSNAALHWVPRHMDLFATWLAALRPGGTLAFQVPGNFNAPSHTLLSELATSREWRPKLAGVPRIVEAHEPVDYYRSLNTIASKVDIWETTYFHRLEGDDPVLEWVRGSALLPYLEHLSAADAIAFTDAYRRALRLAYPAEESGETLFAFRRIFVVASQ
jgi:trans-aconitate 2-methyltransferase